MLKRTFILIVCCLLFYAAPIFSSSIFDWHSIESQHFIVYYPKNRSSYAKDTLTKLENQYSKTKEFVGDTSKTRKTHVLIEDLGLEVGGWADHLFPRLRISTTPNYQNTELQTYHHWGRMLLTHEYTHREHLDNATGIHRFLAPALGSVFAPNIYLPDTLIEGLAIYNESDYSPYEGRLHDGFSKAVIATQHKTNAIATVHTAHVKNRQFPYGHWYLYGGEFVQYLHTTYGKNAISKIINEQSKNTIGTILGGPFPQFGIDRAFKTVIGKSYKTVYTEWLEHDKKRYSTFKMPTTAILSPSYTYFSKLVSDTSKIYYIATEDHRTAPFENHTISAITVLDPQTKKTSILQNELGGHINDIHIQNNAIYYGLTDLNNGFSNFRQHGFGTVTSLYRLNLDTKDRQHLFSGLITAFSVQENGTIFYIKPLQSRFGSELWTFQDGVHKKYKDLPYLVSEMSMNKRSIYMAAKTESGPFNIYQLDIKTGVINTVTTTPWVEKNLSLYDNSLYYTANYHSRYARYRYALKTKQHYKITTSDFSLHSQRLNGQLYFTSLHGTGEGLYQKPYNETRFTPPSFTPIKKEPSKKIAIKDSPLFRQNFWQLFHPRYKGIQYKYNKVRPKFYGEDVLGTTHYHFSLSNLNAIRSDIEFDITTRLLTPLTITYRSYIEGYEERFQKTKLELPIYQSLTKGLHAIHTFYDTDFQKDNDAGIQVQYHTPFHQNMISFQKGVQKVGSNLSISHQYYVLNGHIHLNFNSSDRHYFTEKRRDTAPLTSSELSGQTYTAEYSYPLLTLRKGFWSPNVYIDTVYIVPFMDYNRIKVTGPDYSSKYYGIELQADFYSSFFSEGLIKLGVVVSDTNNKAVYGSFGL